MSNSNAFLRSSFRSFNRRYFGGKLKVSDVRYGKMKRNSGETTFFEGCFPIITIESGLKNFPRLSRLILLHEMVHVERPNADHGPKFKAGIKRLFKKGAYKDLL